MVSGCQRTICNEVSLRGIGVHSGQAATVTLKPSPPGSGVIFIRSDLPRRPAVPATVGWVSGSERGTVLKKGEAEVRTVEHLLAAAFGLGVDNLIVEVDAPELPMGDGSALPFIRLLKEAGFENQALPRPSAVLPRAVWAASGGALVAAFPGASLRISYAIAFDNPLARFQFLSIPVEPARFEREVGPARTFGFLRDALPLMERGLIRGTSLDNTVVIGDKAVFSREGLRFPDEFVRHKILDLVGDLALLGARPEAEIVAFRAGHGVHLQFVAKLREVIHGG